ncbi:MAG: hypothetical protein EXQ83_12785, partial [Xanthobacteraceae bacterium]|nr:hypothetical protein [Xanthobacteraceae bacterium]
MRAFDAGDPVAIAASVRLNQIRRGAFKAPELLVPQNVAESPLADMAWPHLQCVVLNITHIRWRSRMIARSFVAAFVLRFAYDGDARAETGIASVCAYDGDKTASGE